MLLDNVVLKDDHISFDNEGGELKFHYFWLRHHCPCCVHDTTNERTISPIDVNLDIKAMGYHATSENIVIEWPGNHKSVYRKAWLVENAYGVKEKNSGIQNDNQMEIAFKDIVSNFADTLVAKLNSQGAVLVRNNLHDVETIISKLTQKSFDLIETHFGRIEDLRTDNTTNDNTDQLGYTNEGVALHTDQPFIENPPRYQMLYCMRKATTGGENQIVDVKKATYYLRETDEEAFSILTKTPIRLLRLQKDFRSETSYPLIQMDGDEFRQVRSSYFTFAPINLPYNVMRSWYRAYQQLFNILNQPQNLFEFTLAPHDFVIYDNHRMLHGRSGFSGPRWMKGVYFDHK